MTILSTAKIYAYEVDGFGNQLPDGRFQRAIIVGYGLYG